MPKKKIKPEENDGALGAPKLFDVAQPGKTAATATSRPVIVGHGSMIKQDPMVSKPEPTKASSNKGVDLKPAAPDEDNEVKPTQETSDKEDKKQESSDEQPKKEEPEKPAETENNEGETGSEVANELAGQVASKKEEKAKADAQAKKSEEIEKLIESKKYFVQVHQGPSSQNLSTWVLVILLLAVVGVILAIDAEVLNVGLLLPFDLIK